MSERPFVCLVLILVANVLVHGSAPVDTDVLHYAATLEPDIAAKSVKGSVRIRFHTTARVLEFDCGDLTVDTVSAAGAPLQFSVTKYERQVKTSRSSFPIG
jgi:aminopeptidase N